MTVRVYEFSKQSGIPSKELLAILEKEGFELASHMSVLPDKALVFLEKLLAAKDKKEAPKASSKVQKKVAPVESVAPVERKTEKVIVQPTQPQEAQAAPVAPQKPVPPVAPKPVPPVGKVPVASAEPKPLVVSSMTVGEFAENTKRPLSDIILYLLKKGIVANKNQSISEEVVAELARHYAIPIAEKAAIKSQEHPERFESTGVQESRLPIVVVIGHVDHGKTTLLDFIRKTRVAAREKGGITQHLGAYEAHTKHGSIVFLDTPGHEAFSLMRVRGIKAADVAILVVAADDGVMPQTIEAIRAAQSIKLPVVVALNKIDKVNAAQIEKVKHSLSQYELVPEEWGGSTVVMPISAKTGQGVDELLEVVSLQSQLMELSANPHVAARGFILESKLEKGLGQVATVICQQGTLHIGDYFIAGTTQGKVSALIDSSGKRIKAVGPSIPVQVAGFDNLPRAGEPFMVVPFEEYKKVRQTGHVAISKARATAATTEESLNLLVKTDNASSLEAILGSITKLSGKAFKSLQVIHGAVGPITESDVMLAADTGSLIYGLHVKVEPNAAMLAQRQEVTIKLFDIIYKMLEDMEVVAEQGRPVKMVTKKTGEAVVLKVFDIKNLGVIAGAQVKSGICSRNGKLIVWRGKYKVGEGPIKSLQRDKKPVKEVHAGYECAFLIDGYSDWQVDDRVECYLEVPEGTAI